MSSQKTLLSKQQKEELSARLNVPFGRVQLICDGYEITLCTERWKGMTFRVITYVNGVWKGIWISSVNQHPEQKFMRRSERSLCSPKHRAALEKIMGKRRAQKDSYLNAKLITYHVDWASGKAAINHLAKVCDAIEIVEGEAR